MLVGWGGNNGSTFTAGIIANREKICWETKEGKQSPDYFGSITQSSTVRIGAQGAKEIYVPLKNLLPMVEPNDILVGGWDINNASIDSASTFL